MFSQTVDYSRLTPEAKAAKAVQDARDYLGADRFDLLVSTMREKGLTWPTTHDGQQYPFDQFACWCDFAGVRGYPIRALWDHTFPARAGQYETEEQDDG